MVTKDELISQFPARRISPFDGMAITAKVWAEAHDYHRSTQQIQALLGHGPGILVGLEVLASDPADSSVYIQPGIARDPAGQIIVISEAVRFDLEKAEGRLYLLLSYGEGRPLPGSEEGGPNYIHSAFAIEAQPALSVSGPVVELARIRRSDAVSPFVDAMDPLQPGANEIDMRFRCQVAAAATEAASIAVVHLGKGQGAPHGQGAGNLARSLRQLGQPAWVDADVSLSGSLTGYTLAYLVGRGAFQLSPDEMNAVYTYLQGGGTLFIESCQRDAASAGVADAAFADFLGSLGVELGPLPQGHALLSRPSLFAEPPAGYETEGTPQISLAEGVVFSTLDYGCLWEAARRDRLATREEIRAALEWGGNLVAYALARQHGDNRA